MNKITKVLISSLVVNLFLSVIKVVFGVITSYSSLIADGIHSFSDLATDVISIFGSKLSLKPADSKHPFGHGKIEYVTSIIISVAILTLGINLIIGAFDNEVSIPPLFIMGVSLFTIISKYILATYIYKKGVSYQNNILIASGRESKSDVISSIFVFFSIIVIQFSNTISIFKYADIVGTIFISLLIIKTGLNILMDNLSKILGEQMADEDYLKQIKDIILKQENIIEIKNLYILKNGPYYKLLSNVIMNNTITLSLAHETIDEVEKELKTFDSKIKYVFIHMEPK